MSSFGGAYGKTTGDYVKEVKDAIVTMIETLPEITIKDEEDEFVSKEFKEEYEKIYRDIVKYTTPIIKALNGLPVYYRHHIKNGLALGKGLKIMRYQDFTKKRKQLQKRKETKRNEDRVNKKRNEGRVNKKRRIEVEDVEKVEDVETSSPQDVEKVEDDLLNHLPSKVEDVEMDDVEKIDDVEKVEDFEEFVNQFKKRLRVDDV